MFINKIRNLASQTVKFIGFVEQIRRERNSLAGLTDNDLADIGVDRVTANQELQRGIFDLPRQRQTEQLATDEKDQNAQMNIHLCQPCT